MCLRREKNRVSDSDAWKWSIIWLLQELAFPVDNREVQTSVQAAQLWWFGRPGPSQDDGKWAVGTFP